MNTTLTIEPMDFIENGEPVLFEFSFNESRHKIPISCKVVKEPEKNGFVQYKLIVKGEYKRGSTAEITLNHPDMYPDDTDTKMQMAQLMITEIIPEFITKDYPDSLEKIKNDKKKSTN
jgi:hypothetical protein